MQMSRGVPSSIVLVSNTKPLIGALAAALLACSTSYAASFGHSRLVSGLGQPLHINVPVTQLSADDLRSFSAVPAPAAAWDQAGLTPPVDLASLHLHLVDGYAPGSKLIQVRSDQAFNKPVADLLLDISTATGHQRYQVSLLTHAQSDAAAMPQPGSGSMAGTTPSDVPQTAIHVRRGDTMFAIAGRHAVSGVTVYQMMIALQRANPQAFIHDNLNLVKAGATLTMPDRAALTAISDREARRLFQQQAQAFAQYRQRAAASTAPVEHGSAAAGVVTSAGQAAEPESAAGPQDQLRLSGAQAAPAGNRGGSAAGTAGSGDASAAADDAAATRKGIADSEQRVSQLEENVRTLNEALRSQGGAASDLVIDSAKGLSQSIAEATAAVTATDNDRGDANGASAQTGAEAAGQQGAADRHGAAGQGAASGGNAASGDSATTGGSGSAEGSTAAGASGRPGSSAAGGAAAANGATSGNEAGSAAAGNGATSGSATSGAAAGGQAGGQAAGAGSSPSQAGTPAAPGQASGATSLQGAEGANGGHASAGAPAGSAAQGGGTGHQDAAASDADRAAETAESISTKAEQSVSWFQEHMLGVITGLLAFIVLIIAWLLRRANAARDEGRDGNTGPITEAMVKEKLEQINLDLEQQPPTRSRSDTR
ncbi:FimV/HubP family polar landmark protein [Pusillimonas sp. SM2304]|uniref:type IV pilus assembly protein FimV n=1 Tax=Pusillimonas sp. SM2304 TaxID=3073241 RepID=UPI0028743617|nr:FimV/HubP family polar landmark protein [Pusillimonas sp. SM2304]MDS1141776.1 FimV/HubP family polar landmark protein [Pusillimonas sp. SM2304]